MTRISAKAFVFVITTCVIYASNVGAQTPVSRAIEVGEMAPDFTLANHHGRKTTLSESKGKSPVVLVFYRGYW